MKVLLSWLKEFIPDLDRSYAFNRKFEKPLHSKAERSDVFLMKSDFWRGINTTSVFNFQILQFAAWGVVALH